MDLSKRVKAVRLYFGMTQEGFAKKLDLKVFSISRYETGSRSPDSKTLQKIYLVYNVDINWLLTGDGSMFVSQHPYLSNSHCMDIKIESEISAGIPIAVRENSPKYIHIDKSIINNINNYYIYKVNGESMAPGIMHNDIIIIRKSINWIENCNSICAVKLDGRIALKRIICAGHHKLLLLISDNLHYEPIIVDPKQSEVALLGFLHYLIRKA